MITAHLSGGPRDGETLPVELPPARAIVLDARRETPWEDVPKRISDVAVYGAKYLDPEAMSAARFDFYRFFYGRSLGRLVRLIGLLGASVEGGIRWIDTDSIEPNYGQIVMGPDPKGTLGGDVQYRDKWIGSQPIWVLAILGFIEDHPDHLGPGGLFRLSPAGLEIFSRDLVVGLKRDWPSARFVYEAATDREMFNREAERRTLAQEKWVGLQDVLIDVVVGLGDPDQHEQLWHRRT